MRLWYRGWKYTRGALDEVWLEEQLDLIQLRAKENTRMDLGRFGTVGPCYWPPAGSGSAWKAKNAA